MKKLKPIFFGGTASDVGKSVIAAGFCRIFKQDGYSPAPFKAQNMSLNSFATPNGFEIGRAQAVQAEAACIPCNTDMNPVLLKPTTHTSSQIVLHGKPWRNQTAYEYFGGNGHEILFKEVITAFDRLAATYNPVVMEGAGSIAEINLKQRDIVNMRMAKHAEASVYLIADIERGGVFANVYGTLALLSPDERAQVKGIIINKFQGDIRLFDDGKKMLEELIQKPIVGVLPMFSDIYIEQEDSVALQRKQQKGLEGKINIAIVALSRLSNFTDFDLLEKQPNVNVYYAQKPEELENADIIILPGSKNTIADLHELIENKMAESIVTAYRQGKTIIGVCGGYQMLGLTIKDPLHIESAIESIEGLGLLPVSTVITSEKTTRQCTFRFLQNEAICKGYEIHMGETTYEVNSPLNTFTEGISEGFYLNDRCWGTYIHGIFDNPSVINHLLKPYSGETHVIKDFDSYKNEQFDKLAAFLRAHIDINAIYQHLIAE
ncbi:MAG TPA: cobyric acid synthase [Bacteroidales bacterium]|nr:cobyric acid synthase [Bacteroidales bacterium]